MGVHSRDMARHKSAARAQNHFARARRGCDVYSPAVLACTPTLHLPHQPEQLAGSGSDQTSAGGHGTRAARWLLIMAHDAGMIEKHDSGRAFVSPALLLTRVHHLPPKNFPLQPPWYLRVQADVSG